MVRIVEYGDSTPEHRRLFPVGLYTCWGCGSALEFDGTERVKHSWVEATSSKSLISAHCPVCKVRRTMEPTPERRPKPVTNLALGAPEVKNLVAPPAKGKEMPDERTARDGWYECTNCDRPILIATMDDVRRYDMRYRKTVTDNGVEVEYTARCPDCWKPGMVNYPVIRKAGFFRTARLVWDDLMNVVKEKNNG